MSLPEKTLEIEIYTDGSCHAQLKIGAWVALLLIDDDKKVLTGTVMETNHNRMELTAVIKGLEYLKKFYTSIKSIRIFTDSQYVMGLPLRREKLTTLKFATKSGKRIQNADLVTSLFENLQPFDVEWIKVRAHQKKKVEINYNIEVDQLSRKIMRDVVVQQKSAIVSGEW